MNNITLLVLAGGFGTRLKSVVSDVPKPLAPICHKPFLEYLIDNWIEQNVSRFVFLLHHKSELIELFLQNKRKELQPARVNFLTIVEDRPLGTGGAIANAVLKYNLKGNFLVANADTWLKTGIEEVIAKGAPGIGLVEVENVERYGSVSVMGDKIFSFEEKNNMRGLGWVNAGLYYLNAGLFTDWDGEPYSIEKSIFPRLASLKCLNATKLKTDFIDIGIPDDYFEFERWISEKNDER
jgi:NDP-sugar pyrophosphorylase family protein